MVLPVYFAIHALSEGRLRVVYPMNVLSRARALLIAVVIGYILPSVLLFGPITFSMDQIHIIQAVWQGFPLYIAAVFHLLHRVDASILGTSSAHSGSAMEPNTRAGLRWLKGTYIFFGLLCALMHITVFLPSLAAEDPRMSFVEIFIPYELHPYIPSLASPQILPAYRLAIRSFFQYDWLAVATSSIVFFTGSTIANRASSPSPVNLGGWIACMVLLGVLGGPGASIAWAAWMHEKSGLSVEHSKTV